jgi:glycolate oxidase
MRDEPEYKGDNEAVGLGARRCRDAEGVSFADEIRAAVPAGAVISEPEQLRTYECDGLTGRRVVPSLVVLPETTEQVQAVVRACHAAGVPFVARGAGTGLSGGALPVAEGVVIGLSRMTRILRVELESERVVVQPGVTNLQVTEAVIGAGYYYAPDPSSQQVCTIGGNLAENSGGAHCLKYGFTVNHVTGLVAVLPDGEVVQLGGVARESPGPDLLGTFVGSEGTLGIATEITLRVLRRPESVRTVLAAFDSTDAAGGAVSGIVAARILPSAMEMMDRLTIEAAEAAVHPGYPDANALLLVELDGAVCQVELDLAAVEAICREHGAWEIRTAADDHERALLWKGRKSAFAAMGRVANDYYVQDGVVPRTKLPEVLRRIAELESEYGLRVGNVFHAGDGNLHPLVLYDGRVEGEPEQARALAEAILEVCIDAGGSLTGEHGIGTDKACSMPMLFGENDLETMQRFRRAFDPAGLCNPGKVFPTPRLCGEVPGPYRAHPLEKAGLAERL